MMPSVSRWKVLGDFRPEVETVRIRTSEFRAPEEHKGSKTFLILAMMIAPLRDRGYEQKVRGERLGGVREGVKDV